MNASVTKEQNAQLVSILQSSLYPGASKESAELVLSYCVAAGLDPLQKPVHIVPLYDSKAKAYRDVIMPGIGLYRTQASRSNEYGGVSEPEFGEDVTVTFPAEGAGNDKRDAVTITYPRWCKVTVRRIVQGQVCEFTAKEFWTENYATVKRTSKHPNAMWGRRPYAQIAKCAEAQALRKAFPELVGAQPTADEMEGKELDPQFTTIDGQTGEVIQLETKLPTYTQEQFDSAVGKWRERIAEGKSSSEHILNMISTKFSVPDDIKSQIKQLDSEVKNENA